VNHRLIHSLYLIPSLALSLMLVSGCHQNNLDTRISDLANTPTATDNIRKSPNDARLYRYVELPNQMRVVLISDPTTEKAAAALSVYRGSFHEPADKPGLAHFLEHMLFIQTETYPEIDGFQHFISANGGQSNAYTALDHTNYFFDVQPSGFDEAIARFAHFFIDPVISAEYSAREKNAVHSEYQMQIKDDGWRGYMVGKQALNPAHPGAKFTIGSLDTLAGDIHEDLINFFDTQYSADQMGLVVISDRTLDAMEALIRPLFGKILDKDIGPSYPTVAMYTDAQLPAQLEIQSLRDGASVSYLFPLPNAREHYRNKPEQYFTNLIGHEGKGSLYQYLNNLGWIESLGASVGDLDHNSSALSISIDLTAAGRAHIREISAYVFQYIDLIKKTPPQYWLFKEQAQVAELGFRFQEKSRPTGLVYQLAPRINEYPPEDLLVAPYLMQEFDATTISKFLNELTLDNVLIEITAPDIDGEMQEPWFEVPYNLSLQPLDLANVEQAPFTLPEVNPYLPENLSLTQEDTTPVRALIEDPGLTLWLDTDTSFGIPRANLYLALAVEGGLVSAKDRGMAQLYRRLVEDSLSELIYPAYLAGLGYNLSVPDAGFQVTIGGYQDKQASLLASVLDTLFNNELQAERFSAIKSSLLRDWRNSAKDRPYSQAFSALDDTLREGRWPRPILIDALSEVTVADLISWRDEKFSATNVRALLHGNVTRADAEAIEAVIRRAVPVANHAFIRPVVDTVNDAQLLQLPVDHNDAAIVIHVQDPDESFDSRALSALTAQLLQPAYFMDLRTEQQLGYVVSVTNRPIAKRGGISFIVQSPNTSAAELEAATLDFIDAFIAAWPALNDADFEQQKSGLINRLTQTPKNLNEQSQSYWADLKDENYAFDSIEQLAARVKLLQKQDVEAFLFRLQDHLKTRRLLVFTQGKFSDVPTNGRHLTQSSQEGLSIDAVN